MDETDYEVSNMHPFGNPKRSIATAGRPESRPNENFYLHDLYPSDMVQPQDNMPIPTPTMRKRGRNGTYNGGDHLSIFNFSTTG